MTSEFAIIDKQVFLHEDKYSDFLEQFEKDFGKIDHIIQRKAKYHPELVILEVKMEVEEEKEEVAI